MADWTFERDVLFAPKGRQRVRMLATVTTPGMQQYPRNLEHRYGSYYEVYVSDGDVWFRRSHWATPPFEFDHAVTSSGDCSYPWQYTDHRTTVYLLFERTGPDVWQSVSYDEGFSWETPVLSIADGTKPFAAINVFDGTELIAAFIPATDKISGRLRQVGELAYGTAFNFADDTTDLLFEDDTFSFAWGFESPNRLVMHAKILGETATSTWWSADSGRTWVRVV